MPFLLYSVQPELHLHFRRIAQSLYLIPSVRLSLKLRRIEVLKAWLRFQVYEVTVVAARSSWAFMPPSESGRVEAMQCGFIATLSERRRPSGSDAPTASMRCSHPSGGRLAS